MPGCGAVCPEAFGLRSLGGRGLSYELITGKLYLFAYFSQKSLTLSCPIDTIDFIKCVYFTFVREATLDLVRLENAMYGFWTARHLSFLCRVIKGWCF